MALSDSMRRYLLWCSLLSSLSLLGGDGLHDEKIKDGSDLLSGLKQRGFQLQHAKNAADSSQLSLSWINPITISYTDSRNDQFEKSQKRRELMVNVDQPIFKSGGIWAAIGYAGATKKVGDLSIQSQERQTTKQIVATLFNFKKNALQIKKQKLLIANDRLDILRKKEQFLNGDLDSGFLDQAILKKNQDTLQLFVLEDAKAQLRKAFKDLSDADPATVTLPRFTLMKKEAFLARHIDLRMQTEKIEQQRFFKTMTYSRYLPMVSLQASFVKSYENSYLFYGGAAANINEAYHTYGFRVTMPIDVTSLDRVESANVEYLMAQTALLDKRREAANTYQAALKRLEVIDHMMALSKEDERLYVSLVESTREKVEAGEMTVYDLKTMQNARQIRMIDQRIFDIDKQLVLLDLYEKLTR